MGVDVSLQVVGAGLPRTGTTSLRHACERILGGRCCHMSAIPGHPFELGREWHAALHDGPVDWPELFAPWVATMDWPGAMFWREALETSPDAVVVLSSRDSPKTWWDSMDGTVLHVARRAQSPDWSEGRHLLDLVERFAGPGWDDAETMMSAYERHNEQVRAEVPPEKLVEWRPGDGWEPLCTAVGADVPTEQFPWTNRRQDWRD